MAPGKLVQRLYGNSAQSRHGSNEFRPRLSGHKQDRKVALTSGPVISLFKSPAAVMYLPEISYPNVMESYHLLYSNPGYCMLIRDSDGQADFILVKK